METKQLVVLAQDIEILRGLSEKLLDELAEMESVVDAALTENRV